jgi:hypothetical protein
MNPEDAIKAELRLFALETIVCQSVASLYRTMPREVFDAVKQQAIESARKKPFAGLGAAYSDAISAEFEAALARLYSMIQHHLETAQRRQAR